MRIALFCENRYAIDILQPLYEEAVSQNCHDVLWYIHTPKIKSFKLDDGARWTDSMQELYDFSPEAVFVPGNIVPYYLPGVKIQVFHGYAAEKKDHWIIRRYFDTYFTQGPYFTSHFEASALKYKDFEVRETGWTKQDWIFRHLHDYDDEKQRLLEQYGKSKVVLYAPTFSPKLTSLPYLKPALEQLCAQRDILLILKFHPLTAKAWADEYREWASGRNDAIYIEASENVTRYQMMSDVMISDTSSSVYEFLLLDRPVVTFRTIAKDIYWENIDDPDMLVSAYDKATGDPDAAGKRRWIVENYDPHLDGQCCRRMLEQAQDYIARHGVPSKRRLNLWRKYTSIKTFGKINRN
ncbi:MAG: CDP-glycerol glycerophosphotransferase family protein [Bacteroidaceae bacterium]|nr:CDP-glycerol glycerophosphotransferase family protein [Bacteroidaceae bacterium]